MTVYIDTPWKNGRYLVCHLVADSEAEMHEFAARLALKRKWQHVSYVRGQRLPHYDLLGANMIRQALRLGAVKVSSIELLKIAKGMKKEKGT